MTPSYDALCSGGDVGQFRNEEALGSLALDGLPATIIALGRGHVGMPRQALWEYDNCLRSCYLLEYVDSPPLRKNVQRALNRGENYHQLRRAVSYANFGKLRFMNEDDQQLWHECSRLITNCIIFYNTTMLSRVLAHKEATGDTAGAQLIMQVSPVAWQHINLYGRYEFATGPDLIDVDAMVEAFTQAPLVLMEEDE